MSEVFIDNKYQGGYVGDLETLANHFQGGDTNNPLDVDDIIITEKGPLPEVEVKEAVLPEILPPLYEPALPPLQGEV